MLDVMEKFIIIKFERGAVSNELSVIGETDETGYKNPI